MRSTRSSGDLRLGAARALLLLFGALFLSSLALGTGRPGFPFLPWTLLFLLSLTGLIHIRMEARLSGRGWSEHRPYLTLLLLCMILYLGTFRWHGGDDIPNSLLPYALMEHGTLSMDPFLQWFTDRGLQRDFLVYHPPHALSIFSIMPGLLVLPLSVPAVLFGAPPGELFLHNLSKIGGSLITALSVIVFYALVRKRASRPWAWNVTLFYAFGTYAFSVSSQALYSHGPVLLGAALGLYGMLDDRGENAPFLSGLGFGLATACREGSVFFLAAVFLYFLIRRRGALPRFMAGAALPLLITTGYALYYTGRPMPPYMGAQSSMFMGFQWDAFLAMLASPTRGIIFFTPAALFGVWGMFRKRKHPWTPYLAAACLLSWAFFCFRTTWTAGQTFGNRYFAVISMVLALYCCDMESEIRRSPRLLALWTAAFAASILVHALGAYFNWPGRFALGQRAEIWDLTLFPVLNLLRSDGSIQKLPVVLRVAVLCGFVGGAAFLARSSYRSLSTGESAPSGKR